jgi:hypothetical protein
MGAQARRLARGCGCLNPVPSRTRLDRLLKLRAGKLEARQIDGLCERFNVTAV